MTNQLINIVDLPNELLENIFQFLSFEEISRIRSVSKKFNTIGEQLLNRGFNDSVNNYYNILEKLKEQAQNCQIPILKCSELFTTSMDITILGIKYLF